MKQRHKFEHVHTGAIRLPTSFGNRDIHLSNSVDALQALANAINSVRTHGLAQLLGEVESENAFEEKEYRKAITKALRTALDDIQFDGEHIDLRIKWSTAHVIVITLRRREPNQEDAPAPSA